MEVIEFSSEKKVKKLNLMFGVAIVMLIFGLIQLDNKGVFSGGMITSIGDILDSLISFGLATFLIVSTSKKKKKIEGETLKLTEDTLTIQRRSETVSFNSENKPVSIVKKLNTLEITEGNGTIITINLDNYSLELVESKMIAEQVEKLRINWLLTSETSYF